MNARPLHVIFGAGQIGVSLALGLAQRGFEVRSVRRSAGRAEGATVATGDAGDETFATEVTRGAAAIYHCMNPAYSAREWETHLPRLARSLVAAASRNGARLVQLDNLYMLGRTGGRPMNEDTPVAPSSRKGEIRARVAEIFLDAHRRGDVRFVAGRAPDFYGPRGVGSYFGDFFWERVMAGKDVQFPANPDTPHAYAYTLDVAEGLARLGTAEDDVCGGWWMLPAAPALTTRAMTAKIADSFGRGIRLTRVPRLVLSAMGLFVPLMREVNEMAYQWDEPFLVDDSRFRERLGQAPTSLDEGARATVAWAREHYGRAGGADPAS